MKYALKFLRTELNRERSYVNGYYLAIREGRKISPERSNEVTKRFREGRIASLEIAIAKLKVIQKRPEYYWLTPVTDLEILMEHGK